MCELSCGKGAGPPKAEGRKGREGEHAPGALAGTEAWWGGGGVLLGKGEKSQRREEILISVLIF